MSDDLLLTRAQAAGRLGISERTFDRRCRAAGVGPALRRGRLALYALSDVAALVAGVASDVATVVVSDVAVDGAVSDMPASVKTRLDAGVVTSDAIAVAVAEVRAAYTAALVARDEHLADLEAENARLRAEVARLADVAGRRPWWRR